MQPVVYSSQADNSVAVVLNFAMPKMDASGKLANIGHLKPGGRGGVHLANDVPVPVANDDLDEFPGPYNYTMMLNAGMTEQSSKSLRRM